MAAIIAGMLTEGGDRGDGTAPILLDRSCPDLRSALTTVPVGRAGDANTAGLTRGFVAAPLDTKGSNDTRGELLPEICVVDLMGEEIEPGPDGGGEGGISRAYLMLETEEERAGVGITTAVEAALLGVAGVIVTDPLPGVRTFSVGRGEDPGATEDGCGAILGTGAGSGGFPP